MNLAFHKYHGCANDFVLLDLVAEPGWARVDLPTLATRLCDRRRGIGADQAAGLLQRAFCEEVLRELPAAARSWCSLERLLEAAA